jgi:hypothetical protein
MTDLPRFGLKELLLLLLTLAVAAGARAWYLIACADNAGRPAPLLVQDPYPPVPRADIPNIKHPNELQNLVSNLEKDRWYASWAPLSEEEETTAHRAPGYPWLYTGLQRWFKEDTDKMIRWIQAGLGALTAGFYFLFARRAFHHTSVATLAGLLCALHPFWIINTAEINDGVLASLLLAACLLLGARGSQEGEAFTSLLYGLALAALALVRAALLPFALAGILWFLLHCRSLKKGWLCALLAFLGFANGLAPWTLRNFQAFRDLIPIVDTMYLHLWIGNNSQATGGPQSEETLRKALAAEQLKDLQKEKQNKRYAQLGREVIDEIRDRPGVALQRRLTAGVYFVFGEQFFRKPVSERDLLFATPPDSSPQPHDEACWMENAAPVVLPLALLVLLIFGLLGWRWSYGWRNQAMPAALAVIWIPLPYLLSHAEWLSGPRLPLDGVLWCFAAFALTCLVPGVSKTLFAGAAPPKPQRP